MPRTQIPGEQVTDETIRRKDLNVTDTGQSVIRKLIVDTSIDMQFDGQDSGTGDVTLSVAPAGSSRVNAISQVGVPGGGFVFLAHGGTVPHSVVPVHFVIPVEVMFAFIGVGVIDAARAYELRLYSDPLGTPVLEHVLVSLPISTLQNDQDHSGAPLQIAAGDYGMAMVRTSGGGSSTFKDMVATLFARAQ